MNNLPTLLERTYLHNSMSLWFIALGIALVTFIVALLIRRSIRSQYDRYAATQEIEVMELPLKVASRTTAIFLLIVSIFIGLQALDMPDKLRHVLTSALAIALAWQVGVWATTGVASWLERRERISTGNDRAVVGTLGVIGFLVRALIWVIVLLLTLDNLGVNITALVAGLGIGGIAVALAVQNVLGDLLASLSITLDKPFMVGDAIAVDDFKGTVERIGVKSVHLRSISGEQIIMPNSNITASRIRNYGRMSNRRVEFVLQVSYETPREKLQRVPEIVRNALSSERDVRLDRCHFTRYGATGIEFDTVYFVLVSDYNRYMDIQQQANFAIHEAFEAAGIEFAYPSPKVFMMGPPPGAVSETKP